jgi:hypothetical protein
MPRAQENHVRLNQTRTTRALWRQATVAGCIGSVAVLTLGGPSGKRQSCQLRVSRNKNHPRASGTTDRGSATAPRSTPTVDARPSVCGPTATESRGRA